MDNPVICNQSGNNSDLIWLEKYRPKSLKDYLDYQKFKTIVQEYINPIKNNSINIRF